MNRPRVSWGFVCGAEVEFCVAEERSNSEAADRVRRASGLPRCCDLKAYFANMRGTFAGRDARWDDPGNLAVGRRQTRSTPLGEHPEL